MPRRAATAGVPLAMLKLRAACNMHASSQCQPAAWLRHWWLAADRQCVATLAVWCRHAGEIIQCVSQGLRPVWPPDCFPHLEYLGKRCLAHHPDERPSFTEIVMEIEDMEVSVACKHAHTEPLACVCFSIHAPCLMMACCDRPYQPWACCVCAVPWWVQRPPSSPPPWGVLSFMLSRAHAAMRVFVPLPLPSVCMLHVALRAGHVERLAAAGARGRPAGWQRRQLVQHLWRGRG